GFVSSLKGAAGSLVVSGSTCGLSFAIGDMDKAVVTALVEATVPEFFVRRALGDKRSAISPFMIDQPFINKEIIRTNYLRVHSLPPCIIDRMHHAGIPITRESNNENHPQTERGGSYLFAVRL
ncbi:hypothetical protein, partial [Aeromonas australiensis]|uniref:hypothetical protein n=1 Tax=Aeromonas australiensis TaxID=1114880 RepID=UPI001AE0B13F